LSVASEVWTTLQPWATQIVSRANFLKNHHVEGQNIDLFLTDLADFSME
jgi:hypothetical protein